MESIRLDEKVFIKATALAKKLGYTADYIGQLCRAGKVSAQLVGRSWYVEEGSLTEHKRSKSRSNKKVTKKAAAKDLAKTKDKGQTKTSVASSRWTDPLGREPIYSSDETDLFPTPRRPEPSQTQAVNDYTPPKYQEKNRDVASTPAPLPKPKSTEVLGAPSLDLEPETDFTPVVIKRINKSESKVGPQAFAISPKPNSIRASTTPVVSEGEVDEGEPHRIFARVFVIGTSIVLASLFILVLVYTEERMTVGPDLSTKQIVFDTASTWDILYSYIKGFIGQTR